MPFALDSNPAISEISEALNYLLGNFGANLSADPNSGEIKGPTGNIIAYLYKYLAVKYADSADGAVNFSNSPTNRQYYGLRNSDQSVESSNPADYIWKQVAGGFGTTKFLWYQTGGGRQIEFFVDTSAPSSYFVAVPTDAIDLDVVTGNSGQQNALPAIYQWTASSAPPARPSTTSTYTWATATFTPPAGWSSGIPSAPGNGYYLWTIVVPLTVSINVTTSVIDWTNVAYPITAIGITGTAGSTGPRTSTGYVYYQLSSPSAPTAPTLSGFNFLTGQFSTISANWSTNFNAPAATDTTKFWAVYYSVSESTFGGTQTVTVSTVFNWTNFNGLVTFTNLATNTGTTFIDGGNITTNTINVNSLIAGTLTAFTIQTGTSGARLVLGGPVYNQGLVGYNSSGSEIMRFNASAGQVYASNWTNGIAGDFDNLSASVPALRGRNDSSGNGVGIEGRSLNYFGGAFYGGASSAPLYINPTGALPTQGAINGGLCVFNNNLYFHNGTTWKQVVLL
jgi:hypothetical protein